MKHVIVAIVSTLTGCTGQIDGGGSEMHEHISSPLDDLDETQAVDLDETELDWLDRVTRTNLQPGFERYAFFTGNALAEEALEVEVNAELARAEIAAELVLTVTAPGRERLAVVETTLAMPVSGETESVACGYARPAPIDTGMSCNFLVARAVESAEIRAVQRVNETELPREIMERAIDLDAVMNTYIDAADIGVRTASFDALDALRAAGACDRVASPLTDAAMLGEELGARTVRAVAERIRASTPPSVCDYVGAIATPARSEVLGQIEALAHENPLCAGFVASDAIEATHYANARQRFESGIMTGVERGFGETVAALAQSWTCLPTPPYAPPVHLAPAPAPAPSPSGPPASAPPPQADPLAMVLTGLCIPNGCGGCDYITCMATAQWEAANGIQCPPGGLAAGPFANSEGDGYLYIDNYDSYHTVQSFTYAPSSTWASYSPYPSYWY